MALFNRPMALSILLGVIAIDQLIKWIMLDLLGLGDGAGPIIILPFFNLVMVWNTGVSFGLLQNQSDLGPWLLAGLAVAVSIALLVWIGRSADRFLQVALALIAGGAISNAIDRVRFGAVADFFDLHVAGWHWPAFNIADSAIVIGAGLLLYDSFVRRRAEEKDRNVQI